METVWPSLRHSCRSELTRQGISLDDLNRDLVIDFDPGRMTSLVSSLHVAMQMGLYLHSHEMSVRRVVSEDSDLIGQPFLLIVRTDRIFTASY